MGIRIKRREDDSRPVVLKKGPEESEFAEVLTRREAARFLRVSLPTLKRLMEEEALPFRTIGSRVLFGREALARWVNRF